MGVNAQLVFHGTFYVKIQAVHAYGTRHGKRLHKDFMGSRGNPVPAGCGHISHGNHHRFHFFYQFQLAGNHIRGNGISSGTFNAYHNGLYGAVTPEFIKLLCAGVCCKDSGSFLGSNFSFYINNGNFFSDRFLFCILQIPDVLFNRRKEFYVCKTSYTPDKLEACRPGTTAHLPDLPRGHVWHLVRM